MGYDFVLIVTARPTPASDMVVGYAVECALDQSGRPIAAQLNINPASLPAAIDPEDRAPQYAVLHELFHGSKA